MGRYTNLCTFTFIGSLLDRYDLEPSFSWNTTVDFL